MSGQNIFLNIWRTRRRLMAISLFLGICLLSLPVLAGVSFYEGFDDSEANVLDRWGGGEMLFDHSLQLVTSPVAEGARAARFEYRKSDVGCIDCNGNGNYKSDLSNPDNAKVPTGQDRWFGFSMMIPEGQQITRTGGPTGGQILFQIHAGTKAAGSSCGGIPIVSLSVSSGNYDFSVRREDPCSRDDQYSSNFSAGPVVKGRYVNFVVNVKISNSSNDYLKVWVLDGAGDDSAPKVNYSGKVGYSIGQPYVRIGLYAPRMRENPEEYPWDTFVVYFDQYREGTSYADVVPRGSQPPPVTTVINETFGTAPAPFTVIKGGTWGVTGGAYKLTNPASGTATTGNGNISVHNESISGDFTLTAKASVTPTTKAYDDFSIIFNFQDQNNYYYATFSEGVAAATNGINKVVNGVVTQLVTFPTTISAGTTYTIKVERVGSTIKTYRNGTLLATASDSNFVNGKVGFGSINDACTFDDLLVTQ